MAIPVYLLRHDHFEYVDLAYEKITWHYLDGNIIHSDSWKGRTVSGKYTLNLTPNLSNAMCGRSAFRIHGASKKHPLDSSEGCIIAPLSVRKSIWARGDTELKVK